MSENFERTQCFDLTAIFFAEKNSRKGLQQVGLFEHRDSEVLNDAGHPADLGSPGKLTLTPVRAS